MSNALGKQHVVNPTPRIKNWPLIAVFCLLGSLMGNPVQAATAKTYEGTWYGSFTNGQGSIGAVVVLEASSNTALQGRFIFFPVNSNPDIPSGHYTISGTVNPADNRMKFVGKKWLVWPKGYVTVGFSGLINRTLSTITGLVIRDDKKTEIGQFILRRITKTPTK